jgi:cell wall-associated NlpC family hydrolase
MTTHRVSHRRAHNRTAVPATALIGRLATAPAPAGPSRHAAPPPLPHRGAPAGPAPARVRRSGPLTRPVYAAMSVTVLGAAAAVTATTGQFAAVTPDANAAFDLTTHSGPATDGTASTARADDAPTTVLPAVAAAPAAPDMQTVQVTAIVNQVTSTAKDLVAKQAAAKAGPAHVPRPTPPETSPAASAGSGIGGKALAIAESKMGKPYSWGAAGPSAFDCSGLVLWAFKQLGVSLPHSSSAQSTMGKAVSRGDLQPGDLVFFYSPVSHVGIYAGDGKFINAPQTGDVVKYQTVSSSAFSGARRL